MSRNIITVLYFLISKFLERIREANLSETLFSDMYTDFYIGWQF
jgi:hypothetical protein